MESVIRDQERQDFNYAGIGVSWTCIGCLVAWMVWRYANRSTRWLVLLATYIGWWMPFLVVVMMPVDMTSTRYLFCLKDQLQSQAASLTPSSLVNSSLVNATASAASWSTPSTILSSTILSSTILTATASLSVPASATLPSLIATSEGNASASDPVLHLRPDLCDPPFFYVSAAFLEITWRTMYWTMFLLTFLWLPMLQAYCDSGYFTLWGRLKKAIRVNVLYYGILLLVGAIGLIVLAVAGALNDRQAFLSVVMALANLWGLSLVVVFMSFGMIEVPRSLWHRADRKRSLRFLEFKAPKVNDSLYDAQKVYDDLVKEAKAISAKVRFHDDNRPFVDKIMELCGKNNPVSDVASDPDALSEEGSLSRSSPRSNEAGQDPHVLATLNKNLIRAVRNKERYEWEWNSLCQQAFLLQDVIALQNSSDMKFRSIVRKVPEGRFKDIIEMLDWVWLVKLEPIALRALAICCVIMSIIIIWSETIFPVSQPIISILGIIFERADMSNAAVELMSLIFMLYMGSCAIYALFRVRIFDMYSLHSGRATTEISLCWFTGNMCKLAFPLCYNFMNMTVSRESVFSRFMGVVDSKPLFGDFNFYSPILCIVIVFVLAFDIIGRLGRMCGFSDVLFSAEEDKASTWGDVEDGRLLLADARHTWERRDGRMGDLPGSSATGLLMNRDQSPDRSRPRQLGKTDPEANPGKSPQAFSTSSTSSKTGVKSSYRSNHPLYQKYANKFANPPERQSHDASLLNNDSVAMNWSSSTSGNPSTGSTSTGSSKPKLPNFRSMWS